MCGRTDCNRYYMGWQILISPQFLQYTLVAVTFYTCSGAHGYYTGACVVSTYDFCTTMYQTQVLFSSVHGGLTRGLATL